MTDALVSVTIQEDPLPVLIDTGTPKVTITDNSGSVTIIEANPVYVSAAEGNPRVIVNNGGYAGNVSILMEDLIGKLTRLQMDPGLASDLEKLESLWIRIGNELLLTYPEGLAIQEAGREYTDSSILDVVADINVSVDGKINIAYSSITQTTDAIDQRVTSIQGETDDRLVVAESRILQTEESITSTVSRLDTIDGPGGSVELLQSSINQNTDSISLEVTARESVAGELLTAQSNITLLSDSVSLLSTTLDTVTDRVTSAELILGADGINLSLVQEGLADHEYTIGTIQTLLTNQWAVNIAEDVNGNTYATGFGLILHPIWLIGDEYAVEDTVILSDTVYQCLAANIADVTNGPLGTNGATYWVELPDGVKSEFTIDAESFKVRSPDGLQTLFSIGTDQKAYIKGELLVQGLESYNYGEPGESWFKLDPTTGLAEFNNITMVFGSGSSGYSNLSDKPEALSDINSAEGSKLSGVSYGADVTNYTDNRISNDAVEIGGKNLIKGYDYNEERSVTTSAASEVFINYYDLISPYIAGEYTVSGQIKKTANCSSAQVFILPNNYNTVGFHYSTIAATADYSFFTFTFSLTQAQIDSGLDYIRIDNNGSTDGIDATVWVKNLQLEKGNKTSDWTPAPGALAGLDSINYTVIDDGGVTTPKIAANSITAVHLAAKSVTSDKISVTNLSAVTTATGALYVDDAITLNASVGKLKTVGKDSYTDSTSGFYLGMHTYGAALGIGDGSKQLTYYNGVLTYSGVLSGALVGSAIEARSPEDVSYIGGDSWVETVAFNVGRSGNYRIRFEMWNITDNHATYARIYKNGSAVGTTRTAASSSTYTWLLFSEDINGWSCGDRLAIYTDARYSGYPTKIRNVEICSSNSPITSIFL